MITSEQALSYQFQKAGMNGYRASEVDEFVSAVAETLNFQERKVRDMQRIIDELKKNETIIQTTLVNAQKLAMQLTDDAKQSAEDVSAEADKKAAELVSNAQLAADETIAEAEAKAKQIVESAEQNAQQSLQNMRDDIAQQEAELNAELERQRKILQAMKEEVSSFRNDMLNRYKAQVTLIKDLPETIPAAVVEPPVKIEPEIIEPITEDDDENEFPVIDVTSAQPVVEPDESAAGSDLLKLMNDMAENEAQAAAAVNEVASLTSENNSAEEPNNGKSATLNFGGFNILIDDDDDDNDGLFFGGRIQVGDDNN